MIICRISVTHFGFFREGGHIECQKSKTNCNYANDVILLCTRLCAGVWCGVELFSVMD